VLSKKISRRSYELGMQGSIALFMCSAIVGVTAMRRRYAYYAQMEQDALIKHHMRSDPRCTFFSTNSMGGCMNVAALERPEMKEVILLVDAPFILCRYANYINSAKAGYTARLAAGNAAAFPSKQK